ncbi:unnamed protein product [Calicophoron daubneyi]|uniref:Uncharacterized protein n=1 Tax=Calicophoron daubneyi TaxID=300641 RepID=A0AAV2TMM8_CALDB
MLLSFIFLYFTLVWANAFEDRHEKIGSYVDAHLDPRKVKELYLFLLKNVPGHLGITEEYFRRFKIRKIEKFIVAGIKYRVHLRAHKQCITAEIWEKLPVYGGGKELLSVNRKC